MLILCNAFSINMLARREQACAFRPLEIKEVVDFIDHLDESCPIVNAIGHAETDSVVRDAIGLESLPSGARLTVKFNSGDQLLIAQYSGPRLTEGATSLPPGAKIDWWLVS